MSVINNVLKSLETRQSQFTPIEITAIEQGAAPPPQPQRPLFIAVPLLLVLVLVAAAYYHYRVSGSVPNEPAPILSGAPATQPEIAEAAPAEPAENASVVAAAEPPPVAVQEPARNQITGLQIRETETEMRLEFALRERAVAYLRERGESSFVYHLRDIDSRIEAPLMRDNRWIRSLAINAVDSGVDIDFATAADILVETRQQQADGELLWVINLRQKKPEPARAQPKADTRAVVKAPAEAAPAPVAAASPPVPQEARQAEVEAPPVKLDIRSTNPASTAASKLEYAVELMNSGRFADAEKLLLGMLDGSSDYEARRHLIALYARLNRPARQRTLLQASLQRYPQDALLRTEYARLLFQSGGYEDVIGLLGDGKPLDASQHALLAASYQRLDRHQQAIRYYQLALRQDAGNARNWVGLGISQEQSAAFADALESYQRAERLGGLSPRLQDFVDRRSKSLRQVTE